MKITNFCVFPDSNNGSNFAVSKFNVNINAQK